MTVLYNVVMVIFDLCFCFIGGYLIFRCIKPVTKPYESMKNHLKEIKEQWDWDTENGEPPIEFVYQQVSEYAEVQTKLKISMFITGIVFILFGIAAIYEII
jgi:hypothetical protein